jgi:hypothetical protein
MIQRWDALHACNEVKASLLRLSSALEALAVADQVIAADAMAHAEEARNAASAVDQWRTAIIGGMGLSR